MKYTIRFTSIISFAAFAVLVVFAACKKEYDSPPERILPLGSVLTIEELRNLHQGVNLRFDTAFSVYAVVSADESSGNLYRNIHVQDQTGAIVLRLNTPGGIYEGDSVRIYLPGTILSVFQGMMQLDSVDVDNNVVKQATQVPVVPQLVTMDEITPAIQGRLIKLENVEFADGELGLTYSDAVNQTNQNRTLKDCNGNTVLVRTSGYANFAAELLPAGNGSLIAAVGQFGDDMQLYIRRASEVKMTGDRCDGSSGGEECDYEIEPVLNQNLDFSDVTVDNSDYNHPLWLNIANSGTRVWRGRIFQESKYLRATAFGSNQTNSMWLISPPVQVMGPQLGLSFQSATAFWENASWSHPLSVQVSTDFDGCDIDGANWTTITGYNATNSTSPNYTFVASGLINVTDFIPPGFTGNVYIAFVYNGAHPAGPTTTLDLDNIVIQ